MAQIRLLSTTLILTLLIWASADSLVNEDATISIAVSLVPAPGATGMFVRMESASDAVDIKVTGPRRIIEALQTRGTRRVRLPVSERPTGSATLPLDRQQIRRALAEQSNDFSRLAVVAVMPDSLSVLVDHLVSRDVDVTIKRPQMTYEVEPQLQPARVAVRIRESVFNASSPDQFSHLDISTDLERLLGEQPFGKSVTVAVVLDLRPFGPDAEFTPPTVDVTATVKARRSTEKIPTVPVLVALSFANLQRPFSIVTRDGSPLSLVTQTITVTGPTEEVARLLRGETRIHGLIQLREDDFEQMGVFKLVTPEYHLPKGIELAEDPPPLEFKIVYVSADGAGG